MEKKNYESILLIQGGRETTVQRAQERGEGESGKPREKKKKTQTKTNKQTKNLLNKHSTPQRQGELGN